MDSETASALLAGPSAVPKPKAKAASARRQTKATANDSFANFKMLLQEHLTISAHWQKPFAEEMDRHPKAPHPKKSEDLLSPLEQKFKEFKLKVQQGGSTTKEDFISRGVCLLARICIELT